MPGLRKYNKGADKRSFDQIFQIAADRKGGPEALEALLQDPAPTVDLAALPEDRYLSVMMRCILQAGFNWKVIENKWPGFETAFKGFDAGKCALMDDEWFDALLTDTAIVRNGPNIRTVPENAALILELRKEGGIGQMVAAWPDTDFAGLLEMFKSRGARLGGATGMYFLRFVGRRGYVLSRDVVARLIAEGVIDKTPTSKGAMAKVQGAFNNWADQSGRSLTQISRVLAMSL